MVMTKREVMTVVAGCDWLQGYIMMTPPPSEAMRNAPHARATPDTYYCPRVNII